MRFSWSTSIKIVDKVGVKVGGQGQGLGHGVGSRSGVKVWGGVKIVFKVWGQGQGSMSWGQGQGHDRWSQGRSRSVVKVRV